MASLFSSAALFLSLGARVLALPSNPPPSPVVKDRATSPTVVISASNTVIGTVNGGVEQFGGIYYADEPTGDLRLRPPQRLSTNLGDAFDASGAAAACPQMLVSTGDDQSLFTEVVGDLLSSFWVQDITGQTENCLSVSIARPVGTTAGDNLPVLYWIYGGAFEVSHSNATKNSIKESSSNGNHSSDGRQATTPPISSARPSPKTSPSSG